MEFSLKNKTTCVSAERTISEIEQLLAQFGASAIMKEFNIDGRCASLSFKLGNKGFKLPANEEGVYEILFKEKRQSYKTNAMQERHKQAYNVCWRIIKDWLHSQLSLIASGQAQPDQVLLPYLFDGQKTLYEHYKDRTLQIGGGDAGNSQDNDSNIKRVD